MRMQVVTKSLIGLSLATVLSFIAYCVASNPDSVKKLGSKDCCFKVDESKNYELPWQELSRNFLGVATHR